MEQIPMSQAVRHQLNRISELKADISKIPKDSDGIEENMRLLQLMERQDATIDFLLLENATKIKQCQRLAEIVRQLQSELSEATKPKSEPKMDISEPVQHHPETEEGEVPNEVKVENAEQVIMSYLTANPNSAASTILKAVIPTIMLDGINFTQAKKAAERALRKLKKENRIRKKGQHFSVRKNG